MTRILNLGCGTKTTAHAENIDWSIYQRLRAHRVGRVVAPLLLTGDRREKFRTMDDNLIVHDLRKGIPAEDQSVDVVYHSHIFEHIDRQSIRPFLEEVWRVLRPGGIHRVVVPDLERLSRAYLDSLGRAMKHPEYRLGHDATVAALIEQMVRREAFGTSQQRRIRRTIENRILGDARRRGETHMWMWDQVNLTIVLEDAGFHGVEVVDYRSSAIPQWQEIGLDLDASRAQEYKPGSLYVEARR